MKTYTRIFIAALFVTAKYLEQPKCPLTGKWISILGYVHTVESYSAIQRMVMDTYYYMDEFQILF